MAKKNCLRCGHCILRKDPLENGIIKTECEYNDRIKALSNKELMYRIRTGECQWMTDGIPKQATEAAAAF